MMKAGSIQVQSLLMVITAIIIAVDIKVCLCCINGELFNDTSISDQYVGIGEQGSFICNGYGSYLYWYVDGVKVENMTSQELSSRGVSITGDYNIYPPDANYGCEPHYSTLTMVGSCSNNNSEIHCVMLGRVPPSMGGGNTTSNYLKLIVKGEPEYINSFNVVQTNLDTLLMYWELNTALVSGHMNYTPTTIFNNISTIHYPNEFSHTYVIHNPDPCLQNNITLLVETELCVDSSTVTTFMLSSVPQRIQNIKFKVQEALLPAVSLVHQEYSITVEFEVYSRVCLGSLPNSIRLILLDNNGHYGTQSSTAIPWSRVTALTVGDTRGAEVYQTKCKFNMRNNTNYQFIIMSHSTYGQAISDPLMISTFDVIDVQYTINHDTAELCVACVFSSTSEATGCMARILMLYNANTSTISTEPVPQQQSTSTTLYILKPTCDTTTSDPQCMTISNGPGYYSMIVFDWENDGNISGQPAVEMMLNITIPSSTINQPRTSSTMASTSILPDCNYVAETTVIVTQQQNNDYALMTITFGVLFGLCLLVMFIVAVLIGAGILQRKTVPAQQAAVVAAAVFNGREMSPLQHDHEVDLTTDGSPEKLPNVNENISHEVGHDHSQQV